MNNIKSIFSSNLKVPVICLTFFQIIIIPIDLLITQLFANIIDFVTVGSISSTMNLICYAIVCIITKLLIQIIGDSLIKKKLFERINNCKISTLELILNNPTYKLYKSDHGKITENINDDLDCVINLYTETYPAIISSIVKIVCFTIYLCLSNWIVAISLIVISLLQLIPPIVVKRYLKDNYDNCRNIESNITNHVMEAIDGFEIIKLYNLNKWWINKISTYHETYIDIGKKSEATLTAQRSMYSIISSILTYGTYVLLGLYAMLKICPLSIAWKGIYSSRFLYDSVKTISENIPTVVESRVAKDRLSIWNKDNGISVNGSDLLYNFAEFFDVSLIYDGKYILEKVFCEFDLKKKYLITGPNGEGKTTLLNLLSGILLPSKGKITIDEKQPKFFDNDVFPKGLFYIPQSIPEFNFELKMIFEMLDTNENQRFIQLIENFGLSFSVIYEKKLSELSGGERKKVILALAFSLEPKVLLIDEPSNSLDEFGIAILCDLLRTRSNGVIIISHDSNYDNVVDRIYKVKNKGIYYEKK